MGEADALANLIDAGQTLSRVLKLVNVLAQFQNFPTPILQSKRSSVLQAFIGQGLRDIDETIGINLNAPNPWDQLLKVRCISHEALKNTTKLC